jgi:hypothetical protein
LKDGEKASEKIQQVIMIKALKKLRTERSYLNTIKVICNKFVSNIVLNGDKQKSFSIKSGMRQGCLLSPVIQYSA